MFHSCSSHDICSLGVVLSEIRVKTCYPHIVIKGWYSWYDYIWEFSNKFNPGLYDCLWKCLESVQLTAKGGYGCPLVAIFNLLIFYSIIWFFIQSFDFFIQSFDFCYSIFWFFIQSFDFLFNLLIFYSIFWFFYSIFWFFIQSFQWFFIQSSWGECGQWSAVSVSFRTKWLPLASAIWKVS